MNEIEKKAESGLAKIENIIKGAIVNSENKILHRRLRLIEFALLGAVVIVSLVIWRLAGEARRERLRTTAEMTYIADGFKLHDLGPIERHEKFRKFALRIFSTYGFRYNKNNIKAMNKKQKLAVIDLIWEMSEKMNFDPYMILCMGILETALNPNAIGGYGEWGWLQQKEGTARFAERMLQLMPDRFRRKLAFRITDPEDLLDPIVATKVAFVLLYTFRRDYRGREEWYVSIYHWGGFLSRYWRRGKGHIPRVFTINDIKYDVYAYYASYKTLLESFNAGQLEPGKAIVKKYKRKKSKLIKEELQLHQANKVLAKLEKKVSKRDNLILELTSENKDLKKHVVRTRNDLLKIFGIARTGKVSRIRATLKKARGPIKELLKQIEKDDKAKFVLIIIGIGLGLLLILAGFGYGSFRFVQYAIRRWKK